MSKKWIIPLACLTIVFTLAGCTGRTDNNSTVSPSVSPSVTPSATPSAQPTDNVNNGHAAGENGNSNILETTQAPDASHDVGNGATNDAADNANTRTNNNDGLLGNVGNAVRDTANGVERAVRDIL